MPRADDWNEAAYWGICIARVEDKMKSILASGKTDPGSKISLLARSKEAPNPPKGIAQKVVARLQRYVEENLIEGYHIWFELNEQNPKQVAIEMWWSKEMKT